MKETLTLQLEHRGEEIVRFQEELSRFLENGEVPIKRAHTIMVAMEEVILNVIHYAAPHGAYELFTVYMELSGNHFLAEIRDFGEPFDPLAKPDPDTSANLEERPIGGLGIVMVKQLMTDVRYSRKGGQNCLELELRW